MTLLAGEHAPGVASYTGFHVPYLLEATCQAAETSTAGVFFFPPSFRDKESEDQGANVTFQGHVARDEQSWGWK